MFTVHEDMTVCCTRGDYCRIPVRAVIEGKLSQFKPGDILRCKIFRKRNCQSLLLQRDFPVETACESRMIELSGQDTKFGPVISKPTDYWYEIELNPDTHPHTILGYSQDGPLVFRLYPEGKDASAEDVPALDFKTLEQMLHQSLQAAKDSGLFDGAPGKNVLLYTPGDLDGNGVIDEDDAYLLLEYLANDPQNQPKNICLPAADVNGDGLVDMDDLDILWRFTQGEDVQLCYSPLGGTPMITPNWSAGRYQPGHIQNRTHYQQAFPVKEPVNICWDGNPKGLTCVADVFYKVSDNLFSDEQLKNLTVTFSDGQPYPITQCWDTMLSQGWVTEAYTVMAPEPMILVIRKDGAVWDGITFPEAGLYFFMPGFDNYTKSLTGTEPMIHKKTELKKLEEKYLPEQACTRQLLWCHDGDILSAQTVSLPAAHYDGLEILFRTDTGGTYHCSGFLPLDAAKKSAALSACSPAGYLCHRQFTAGNYSVSFAAGRRLTGPGIWENDNHCAVPCRIYGIRGCGQALE